MRVTSRSTCATIEPFSLIFSAIFTTAKITSAMAVNSNARKENVSVLNTDDIFIHNSEAVWEHRDTYGPPGLTGLLVNYYAALCAAFAAVGGLIFGYDQGVVSVVLVMPQFLTQFPRVSDTASGAGFWKGLLTAMIGIIPNHTRFREPMLLQSWAH